MLEIENLAKEELDKYKKFKEFYSPDFITKFNETFLKSKNKASKMDFYNPYLDIVNKTGILIKELGIKDPFQASVVFEYLLWNGYLSKDKNLVYCISGRIINLGLIGADVVRGKSVCLNNAAMLADVLNSMNIESHLVACKIDTGLPKNEFEYKPNIERNIIKKVNFKHKLLGLIASHTPLKRVGNHAVTLFKVGEHYFINDPTNLAFLEFDDFLHAKYIGSELTADIKPWLLFSENMGSDDLYDLIAKTWIFSDEQLLTVNTVRDFSEASLEICNSNLALLDDFQDDIKEEIDIVTKTLVKK